jgi:hypothetical protein
LPKNMIQQEMSGVVARKHRSQCPHRGMAPAPMGDELVAMDAKRRYRMDGKTFDALIKQTATSTGRRRLVQAVAAAGLGGFVSRRGTAAVDVGTEACQRRQGSCDRRRECECLSGGAEFENVTCDRLKKRCNNKGDRCCGQQGATCDVDCDCCRDHRCNSHKKCL